MVCQTTTGTGTVPVTIRNMIPADGKKSRSTIQLSPNKSVESLFAEIGQEFSQNPDTMELMMQNNKTGDYVILNEHKDKTIGDFINLEAECRYVITVGLVKVKQAMNLAVTSGENCGDDDLLLGASASPVTGEYGSNYELVLDFVNPRNDNKMETKAIVESPNYVGLVNQAMTCYLNSLIQALYMTPEFRNALYNWEFKRSRTETEEDRSESKSIPFQLQKLFLNLQTSKKSAVETTDLTSSFGWDLQAAWEQHDIQELCRVMFEALEQKFKDTKQANLINDLYEGKMLDYVKCLECSTEKSREDTFLDIPLPVRPFGSNVAYNSVEEALRAFVQPETLEGVNQYHCEKCNKKCDAHKGLKFIKFPYLLTLHLKRFDFDYSTMHRIKLNDKVVFPKILNLNSFIPGVSGDVTESYEEHEAAIKGDDCSTTDSGSALDDESCQGIEASSTTVVNGQEETCQEDDEGIDVSSGNNQENEKNRLQEQKGPYCYELFSIMIHSGSASGGHYYAYIKDFLKDQWFCFNDQSVTPITEEDIRKTYGGGPQRGYYSGAYTSSTNAYMLMYRKIDKERNAKAMTVDEFPPHITKLLHQMREKEERDRLCREKENDMFKMKIYCYHPLKRMLVDTKIYAHLDQLVSDAVSQAYKQLKLSDACNLEDCRIVSYNKQQDYIEQSFEGNDLKFYSISQLCSPHSDWYLEIKDAGSEFQVYKPGGINVKVYVINIESEEIDGPSNLRVNAGDSVYDLKLSLAKKLNMNVNTLHVVEEAYSSEPQYLDDDTAQFKFEDASTSCKVYVSNALDEEPDKTYANSKLARLIERFVNVISIDVLLPDTDIATLESLSIPSLDINQNIDRLEMSMEHNTSSPSLRVSPQPGSNVSSNELIGDQSNSEDSSLCDSDRTLVGDAPGDCLGLLSSSSNSPADQHMASPTDPTEDSYFFGNPMDDVQWAEEEIPEPSNKYPLYYFRPTLIPNYIGTDCYGGESEAKRCCKVLLDKRMNLGRFKKYMEPVLGVPSEYFKVYRHYTSNDVEWSTLSETFLTRKDGDKLTIKLGRVLRKDEFLGKVYHLTPDSSEHFKLLFEWIVGKGQLVGQVKREVLTAAKKQHMLEIPYNKCRLRKKTWKDPAKVYYEDQRFVDDVSISNNFEIFLQELPDGEKATCPRQLVLFVRRWNPSTITLSPFHEVVLDNHTIDDLKAKIEEVSKIPQEFVEVAYVKQAFPCDMNILCVHRELDWNPTVPHLEDLQVTDDGSVFFYRDSREALKEITSEEKKEIHQREKARLDRFSSRTYASPRRERALKIYVDTSPNKAEDAGID